MNISTRYQVDCLRSCGHVNFTWLLLVMEFIGSLVGLHTCRINPIDSMYSERDYIWRCDYSLSHTPLCETGNLASNTHQTCQVLVYQVAYIIRPMLTVNMNMNGETTFPGIFWLCSCSRSWKSFSVLTINVNVDQRNPAWLDFWRRPLSHMTGDYLLFVWVQYKH